jgi:Salmonella virulence plasmid 65kDa B protein
MQTAKPNLVPRQWTRLLFAVFRKTTATLLAVSFLVSPMQLAFARDSDEATTQPAKATSAPSSKKAKGNEGAKPGERPPVTLKLPEQSNANLPGLKNGEDTLPPDDDGEFSTLTEDDPFPFSYGRVSHTRTPTPSPDQSTGALQYTFPIIAPPGRNGLEPSLALVYDSSFDKNEYLGLGWTTNIPYIERINRTGAENMYSDNFFYSSLDGELREVTSEMEEMSLGGGESFFENMIPMESLETPPGGSIREQLEGKSAAERENIKGAAVAEIGPIARAERANYDIEVVSMNAIQGGVEVFARAWDADGQIGFGTDGTVDIERFRIFNPPILVPDNEGDILQEWEVDQEDGTFLEQSRSLREDLQEALFQVLEHNLSVMENIHGEENIIEGKIGKTTSTFYASTGDGHIESEISGFNWDAAHDAAAGTQTKDAETFAVSGSYRTGGGFAGISRVFLPFDTSTLPDTDAVDSATVSVYPTTVSNGDNDGDDWMNIIQATQATSSSLVDEDFDQCGAINNPNEGATRIDLGSFTTSAYNTFTLNATGTA